MRNVTITVDETAYRWAKVEAARQDTSLSRMLGELIREKMLADPTYRRAMEGHFADRSTGRSGGGPYPKREEIYDRPRLRR